MPRARRANFTAAEKVAIGYVTPALGRGMQQHRHRHRGRRPVALDRTAQQRL